MFRALKNRQAKIAIAAALLGFVAWLAFGFFGIQAAFIDNEVSEANPFALVGDAPGEQASGLESAAPRTTTRNAGRSHGRRPSRFCAVSRLCR